MAHRSPIDLSHFSFNKGEIGHLQTLACVPVYAGDSLSVSIEGIWRLSPLRRNLVVDCQIDMFAFFVPHRHIYGEEWIKFIKDGKNAATVFPGVTLLANASFHSTEYLAADVVPLWVVAGYNRIWNRYFRSPTDDASLRDDDYMPTGGDENDNGHRCGYLPQPWSTGVIEGVLEDEREVPVVADTFDIVDLNRVQAEYRTEVDREYFGERYNDLLNTVWGSTVNTDADERPTLCGHSKWWLSGYDVDGTGDATLGTYSGKSAGIGSFSLKRKFFSEHGALWIMCLPRFPTIHTEERHFLHKTVDPTYLEIGGDPALVAAEPPIDILQEDYFRTLGAVGVLGVHPYGQWYRYHPNHVHRRYADLDGFTFIDSAITAPVRAHYHVMNEYDEVFQTTQLGHWQNHARIDIKGQRAVPGGRTSLYAGA